jgi:hypothetical protein
MSKITLSAGTIAALGMGVLLAGMVYAQTASRSGESIVGRVDYVEVTDNSFAEIIDHGFGWIDVPGMTKTFNQGGLLSNEVIVDFSGAFATNSNTEILRVRLFIDDVLQPGSGEDSIIIPSGKTPGGAGGITNVEISKNFISAPLAPGNHTVRVQAKVDETTGSVNLGSRSMIIHHR